MKKDFPTVYNPSDNKDNIINFWLEKKFYYSKIDETKKPFVIVIPPPNITGALHMGHALNNTIQDLIIRLAKIKGYNTLWVPGTDHGGIATQNVVEKILLKQGKTKKDLGREKFLEFMWEWRKQTGDTILNQLKNIGCLCDWEKTRFTMDDICSKAVYKAFKILFDQGYIYRGERMVNWCPRCKTALADIEVEYKQQKDKLYYIKYPIKSKKKLNYITVATVRPETMLGDTALAVNPKDERYKNIIEETVILPLINREIKIIQDEIVDPQFGSGVVKVTPAHDNTDFEIAQRHNLEILKVIDEDGKMINVGKYSGLDRFDCRKKVEYDLIQLGLIEKIEDYIHNIGVCYRCDTIIEPLISNQWFVRMQEIANKAHQAISEGKVIYYPEVYKEYTLKWLENIKDWCISRQIWWGHRIPVWYCENLNCKPIVSLDKPEKCQFCGNSNLTQDEDVLDTWFSSALWPFSVFKWGIDENNPELKYYYPTSILVTGYEILYLWVARMIMMGLHFLNEVPFREVFVHGIVRDIYGKKMSKSLGNVIDPLDIVEKYGPDALRFSLIASTSAGKDIHLAEENFVSSRNFMNKIYNMVRFILINIDENKIQDIKNFLTNIEKNYKNFDIEDQWILNELKKLISNLEQFYKKFFLGSIAHELYNFVWFKFCDWYLEISKINLQSVNEQKKVQTLGVLLFTLEKILILLHPITPFLTEYVYQKIKEYLPQQKESLLNKDFEYKLDFEFDNFSILIFELIKNIISEIRTIRNNFKLQSNIKPNIIIATEKNQEILEKLKDNIIFIKKLAFVNEINLLDKTKNNFTKPRYSSTSVVEVSKYHGTVEVYVLLEKIIDLEKEKKRIEKEINETKNFVKYLEEKLNNNDFLNKAPVQEIEKIKEKHCLSLEKLKKLENLYKDLN